MAAIALHHHHAGSGEPLVAIHGIGSTWQVWRPVLPALEARHDVLALSLPGYGESAPVEGEPTVPALTDAVEQAMDAAGFETAHVVGNSLGGWIAAELAVRGRARSAVAISPAGLWTEKEWARSERSLRNSYATAQRLAPHAALLAASAPGRTLLYGQVCARPWRMDAADAAYALRVFAGSPSFSRTLRWIGQGPRMPAGLGSIKVPFRVLWGRRDYLLPSRQGPRWAQLVPKAELIALDRLGHVPMSDDPEQVAGRILEFTAGAAGNS